MLTDQLTRGERIRLEALSQSISFGNVPQNDQVLRHILELEEQGIPHILTEDIILKRAERIERWLIASAEHSRKEAN